jgi:hypothetical protein
MRSTLPWLTALIATSLAAAASHAQYPMGYPSGGMPAYARAYPYPYPPPRVAPDMCGPGFYATNRCGAVYGPNYCVYPPFAPYNGERPNFNKSSGSPAFMTHPFAHGPRDYFMLDN